MVHIQKKSIYADRKKRKQMYHVLRHWSRVIEIERSINKYRDAREPLRRVSCIEFIM